MISLPNSIPFHEQNPYHLNEFDQETAKATFERIGAALVLRQYHAQGSLIRGDSDGPLTGASRLADHVEPEHCNHFLAIFNAPEDAARTVSAQMQMVVAPEENTYMLDLERANKRLWRTNQELARGHLGKADSASAALLAKVPPDPDEEPEPEPPEHDFPSLRPPGPHGAGDDRPAWLHGPAGEGPAGERGSGRGRGGGLDG